MLSLFKGLSESTLKKILKKGLDKVLDKILDNKKKRPSKETYPKTATSLPKDKAKKTHPWRLCPIGEHWVTEHDMSIPPSSKGPGYKTLRKGHCRQNNNKKELYTALELREISLRHFEQLRNDPKAMPIPDTLGFPNGNKYDLSIAGWTKFWNETLKPERPVSPDFIKVLISTESSFNILPDTSSKIGPARGLIQITEQTRKILQDPKGELRDHLIELTAEESRETEPNIAAGIRWLYHKRELLERRIKRETSWEEAGAEYKGIFSQISKNDTTDRIMQRMKERHKKLNHLREGKKH
jgi:hypothetical protein